LFFDGSRSRCPEENAPSRLWPRSPAVPLRRSVWIWRFFLFSSHSLSFILSFLASFSSSFSSSSPSDFCFDQLKLVGEYGLKNKREVWRVMFTLSKIRKMARELLTLSEKDPKRIFEVCNCSFVLFLFWRMLKCLFSG
jgi:hypothetical protein